MNRLYCKKNYLSRFYLAYYIIFISFLSYSHNYSLENQEHPCSWRDYYSILQPLFNKYSRPITILELNPETAHLMCGLTNKYESTGVLWGGDKNTVCELCRKREERNIVVLSGQINTKNLTRFGGCEHIDVTMVLKDANICLPTEVKECAQALSQLGDIVIIERASSGLDLGSSLVKELLKVSNYEYTVLGKLPHSGDARELVAVKTYKQDLVHTYFHATRTLSPGTYVVSSDFATKKLHKKQAQLIVDWQEGINLYTYIKLNGVYPTREEACKYLMAFKGIQHNDFLPCNIIVQGTRLLPIDFDDKRRNYSFKKGFSRCLREIRSVTSSEKSEKTVFNKRNKKTQNK